MERPAHMLSDEHSRDLSARLNAHLAATLDLALQAKHAHWNVKGAEFYGLHKLFDRIAKHLHKQADRIAERAATLGGYAEGTARIVARSSMIGEYDLDARGGLEHVAALSSRLAVHVAALRAGIAACAELGDAVTESLLTDVVEQVEADAWWLESHRYGERKAPAKPAKAA